jgi:hypothetical protein
MPGLSRARMDTVGLSAAADRLTRKLASNDATPSFYPLPARGRVAERNHPLGGTTMTKSGLLLAAALALTVTAGAAEEDRDSANFMLPACRGFLNHSGANILFQGRCAGVIEGMVYLGKSQCVDVPGEATVTQAVSVVVAYIDARPARMHESFNKLAIEALRAAWPCK